MLDGPESDEEGVLYEQTQGGAGGHLHLGPRVEEHAQQARQSLLEEPATQPLHTALGAWDEVRVEEVRLGLDRLLG